MTEQIRVSNVSYEYETDRGRALAVKDISFSVDTGEFLCVLGPSGCGKTTILNLLAGFLVPTKGDLSLGAVNPATGRPDCGVVFQDFAQLFPWRTALENIEFGLELREMAKAPRRIAAVGFLQLVGLAKFANVYPHQLSGGMQQRVAIARALAYAPAVLLMDEPFAALDAMTRDEMQRQLADIWAKTKKTIVYITHNVSEAVYLADKVLILDPHPGTVKTMVKVDLPRPRQPLSADFADIQRSIVAHLQPQLQ